MVIMSSIIPNTAAMTINAFITSITPKAKKSLSMNSRLKAIQTASMDSIATATILSRLKVKTKRATSIPIIPSLNQMELSSSKRKIVLLENSMVSILSVATRLKLS